MEIRKREVPLRNYLFVKEAKDDRHHGALQCLSDDQNVVDYKQISGARFERVKGHDVEDILKAEYGHQEERGAHTRLDVLVVGGGQLFEQDVRHVHQQQHVDLGEQPERLECHLQVVGEGHLRG